YNYLDNGNKKYIILIFSTFFIHYSFLMIIPIFLFYLLLGTRNFIYYILIILSFIGYEFTPEWLRIYGMKIEISESINQSIMGYTNEEYLNTISEIQSGRLYVLNNYIQWTNFFMLFALLFHKIRIWVFDSISE